MTAGLTFTAAFLGVLARIFLPYLRKKRKQEKLGFRYGYLGTALVGLIITLLIFYKVLAFKVTDFPSGLRAFSSAFGVGFG